MLVKLTDIDCFEHSGNEGPRQWVVTPVGERRIQADVLNVEPSELPNIVDYVRNYIGNFYNTTLVDESHLHIEKFTYLIKQRVVAMQLYPMSTEWEQLLLVHGNSTYPEISNV